MNKTIKQKLLSLALALITAISCVVVAPFTKVSLPQSSALTEEQTMTKAEYDGFVKDLRNFPINFIYDDIYFSGFHPLYFKEVSRTTSSERNGELTTIVLERDILQVKIETAFYVDYNAYDYRVFFTNSSFTENTGVIGKLNSVDMTFEDTNPRLKGIWGDHENNYRPYDYDLTAENNVFFNNTTGRATHITFPYFNLEMDNGGAMIAIGWAGNWEANINYNTSTGKTRFNGTGTLNLNTYLKPGETIRTPLIGIVRYYERNEDVATNAWRSWVVDCNLPREKAGTDEVVNPSTATCLAYDSDRPNSDGSISEYYGSWKPSMDAFFGNGLTATFRWFDAGWYYSPYKQTVPSDWWGTVGTWDLDMDKWRYPSGYKINGVDVSGQDAFEDSVQYAAERGVKTLVWFEPERVTRLDGMVSNYGYDRSWVLSDNGNNNIYVNNLGNKDALNWVSNRIIAFMDKYKIDMYREDFNLDPTVFFQVGDGYQGANRSGITENLYYQGHYQLWDNIIDWCSKNGKCPYVDSCASGGGRNDLETIRRSIPLLRSDADRTTIPLRLAYTTSLVKWLPYTGAVAQDSANQLSTGVNDTYTFRATYLPHMTFSAKWSQDTANVDWNGFKKAFKEWNEIKQYFFNDFYVLTPYIGINDSVNWTSYMYFDADRNSGVLQAFRPDSDESVANKTVVLRGLDPNSYYTLTDIDGVNNFTNVKGSDLMSSGITLKTSSKRTAMIIYINPVV